MTIREIFRLSHRELLAYKARSRATIVTVGVMFGLLFAMMLIMQGLENVTLRYAGAMTDGKVILATDFNDMKLMLERINKYHGEIITLTDDQKTMLDEDVSGFVVVKFSNLEDAYNYYRKFDAKELHYRIDDYRVMELFGNQMRVRRYFSDNGKNFVRPISIVLTVVSMFILAFTLAHLLESNTKSFVLYRSIGASKGQILAIYFAYLLELCMRAVLFAFVLAIVLAGIATLVGWKYLMSQFAAIYPDSLNFWPILVGVNFQIVEVVLLMFIMVPVAFLLCLDQFSSKKIAQRLKGD